MPEGIVTPQNPLGLPQVEKLRESEYSLADREAVFRSMQMTSKEAKNIYQEMLVEKWSGRLAGPSGKKGSDWLGQESEDRGYGKLRSEKAKLNMALLLENQNRYQRQFEMKVIGNRVLQQDTTTADESLPTKAALPIVRRAYAPVLQNEMSSVQPMAGPTAYIFFFDFIRETDSTNLLSTEYNWLLTPELGVPPKGKATLRRILVQALKQLLGVAWSSEAEEDLQAQLGLDLESEIMAKFTGEFVRNLFGRHIKNIYNASSLGTSYPAAGDQYPLPQPWGGPNPAHTIPAPSGQASADRKQSIYNVLIDADTDFRRMNMEHSNAIICGLGLAGLFQKMITLVSATTPDSPQYDMSIGYTNYGTYEGRWTILATEFLPDNVGFLFRRNPDQLEGGHIYAPYIPITATPRVYADFDPVTGNYQNRDAWTRNIRERSVDYVTKPYAFQPIVAASTTF